MRKADLKDGMRVVLRNGEEYIVAGNMIDNMSSWDSLYHYNEDLTNKECNNLDIVEVYDWEVYYIYGGYTGIKKRKVWERPWKPKEGEKYFIPHIARIEGDRYVLLTWVDSAWDNWCFDMGLVFRTREEAIDYTNKMLMAIK